MGIKLRDYMDKDKMELTREEIRELLYEIFNVSKDEQKILAEKLELENNTYEQENTINLNISGNDNRRSNINNCTKFFDVQFINEYKPITSFRTNEYFNVA